MVAEKRDRLAEQTIFGPALRDVTPDDGVTELTAEQMSKAGPIELVRYQRELAKARAVEAVRARQLEIGQAEYKNKLAALLKAALRPKAALRLGKLLKDHKDDASGTHDGVAMWKALVKLKYEPSSMIEQREHDRAVEAARDTSLPDGCSAQDFSDKVNMLMEQHLPYCERKYEGEALSTYIKST